MQSTEELYRTYSADLFRYLVFLTHDPDRSEDLLMETFLHAISASGKFRGESSVKTWLFGIARNLWMQELRRLRRPAEEYLIRSYMEFSPEDTFDIRETLTAVKRLLSQKDERARQIVLFRMNGYAYAEIAQNLGISENSARVIEFRTKRWLLNEMKKEGLEWTKSHARSSGI